MSTRKTSSFALAALAVALIVGRPATVDAKPGLIAAWAQLHGSVANGQGTYFSAKDAPYVGFGGQLGVRLIVFEAFLDVNVFDTGQDVGEDTATMWNQLGGGVFIPIGIAANETLRVFGRANVTYAFAPFAGPQGDDNNRGFAFNGGGGLDYMPSRFFGVGAGVYGGYHLFGSREENGSHIMGQLYTRFELGF